MKRYTIAVKLMDGKELTINTDINANLMQPKIMAGAPWLHFEDAGAAINLRQTLMMVVTDNGQRVR